MKKILFVLIALFSLNYCFSQEEEFPASESGILELTDNEQKAISDMFDFSLTSLVFPYVFSLYHRKI